MSCEGCCSSGDPGFQAISVLWLSHNTKTKEESACRSHTHSSTIGPKSDKCPIPSQPIDQNSPVAPPTCKGARKWRKAQEILVSIPISATSPNMDKGLMDFNFPCKSFFNNRASCFVIWGVLAPNVLGISQNKDRKSTLKAYYIQWRELTCIELLPDTRHCFMLFTCVTSFDPHTNSE